LTKLTDVLLQSMIIRHRRTHSSILVSSKGESVLSVKAKWSISTKIVTNDLWGGAFTLSIAVVSPLMETGLSSQVLGGCEWVEPAPAYPESRIYDKIPYGYSTVWPNGHKPAKNK
jgi:hypothetical protein